MHATVAATPSPHVVCAKFRVETCTPSASEPQPLSSPTADQWDDPWSGGTIPREADCRLWGRRESKEDIKQQRRNAGEGNERSGGNNTPKEDLNEGRMPDAKSESLWYDINIGDGTQGTWLILDALNEFGTWLRPPADSCLTVFPFLSAFEPSACLASVFTGDDQHHFDSELPTP